MPALGRVSRRVPRSWFPKRTVRLRLTLLYGGLVLLSGTTLLVITVLLATRVGGLRPLRPRVDAGALPGMNLPPPVPDPHPPTGGQWLIDPHRLLLEAGAALTALAVLSIAVGWLVAGRLLRPLRVMTATTRQISADDLHRRLGAHGPDDELTGLSNTIDGLLDRLESAFEAQRRFVANVSHELRTPLTLERAMLEVALADPGATAAVLRETCQEVLEAGRHQERLIEALLALADSQRGIDRREPVDLAARTRGVLGERERDARHRQVRLSARLEAATASGDWRLVERLVVNLVDNALRYNLPAGGEVEVVTVTAGDRAVLVVSNTGPVVPPDQTGRLLQPFQRLSAERAGEHEGFGLGLSIVAAVAAAHGARLDLDPRPHGGLRVQVSFPATAAAAGDGTRFGR